MGNDYETRKRRARQEAEEDIDESDNEEDRLAGLLRVAEGDSDDDGLDEHDKQQLLQAHALKGNVSIAMHISMASACCCICGVFCLMLPSRFACCGWHRLVLTQCTLDMPLQSCKLKVCI